MTLYEMYTTMSNTSPKYAFIQRLARVTKKSEKTVRTWLLTTENAHYPDQLTRSVIAKELRIPARDLFPDTNTKKANV